MAKLPGVNHLDAIRALEKPVFTSGPQGKHIVMTDGVRIVHDPASWPRQAITMVTIVRSPVSRSTSFGKLL